MAATAFKATGLGGVPFWLCGKGDAKCKKEQLRDRETRERIEEEERIKQMRKNVSTTIASRLTAIHPSPVPRSIPAVRQTSRVSEPVRKTSAETTRVSVPVRSPAPTPNSFEPFKAVLLNQPVALRIPTKKKKKHFHAFSPHFPGCYSFGREPQLCNSGSSEIPRRELKKKFRRELIKFLPENNLECEDKDAVMENYAMLLMQRDACAHRATRKKHALRPEYDVSKH